MKKIVNILLFSAIAFFAIGQDFTNGELEGTVLGISSLPPDWIAISMNDPNCNANFPPGATPDLTSLTGPDLTLGLNGNAYSGNTFVSAIAADSDGAIYMEGIMQTVTGFEIDSIYEIHFYQSVVKQANMKDKSGSWVVFKDNTLIGVSETSTSFTSYNSNNFNWDKRSLVFTATSSYHIFKFMAKDDDENGLIDEYDTEGAVRVGIDSLFITPWCNLNADLGHDTILCSGDSLLLSVTSSNAEYLWQDGSTGDSFLVTESGEYSVQVSNSCGELSDQVYIEFDDSVDELDLGLDIEMCEGDSLLLQLNYPNVEYEWQDGSTGPNYQVSENGLYWIEMSSEYCTNTDSVFALFHPLPYIELQNDTLLCEGQTLLLESNVATDSYLWQDLSTYSDFEVNQSGEYWLEVMDNGCTSKDEIVVDFIPIPHVRLGRDTMMCLGQRLLLNAKHRHSNISWQDESSSSRFVVNEPGTYFAEVLNVCGFDSDTIKVDYEDCKCFVYIPNSFTPNSDGRNDQFSIKYDCFFETYNLRIYDRWGQLVFESSDPNAFWDGRIKGNDAGIGVFAFVLEYDFYGLEHTVRSGTLTLVH